MFEIIFVNQKKLAQQAPEVAQAPIASLEDVTDVKNSVSRRCSEHVHFAFEFDGLDFCDFLVRDSSGRQQSSPSPVVSSH